MGIPMYMRIKQFIKSKIDSGEWPEEYMIPSESELSKQFGCSRITVTTALRELVKDGLVYRMQGKGTFVSKKTLGSDIYEKSGLAKSSVSLEAISIPGEHVCADVRVELPSSDIARALSLADGQEVITIVRTKIVDGKCFSSERVYLPYSLYFPVLDSEAVNKSLTEISQLCEVELGNSYMSSEPVLSDAETSKLLGIPENSAVLKFTIDIYDPAGRQVACEFVFTKGKSEKVQINT